MEVKLSGGEEYDRLISPVRKLCKFISLWPLDLDDVDGDVTKLERARKWQRCHGYFVFLYLMMLTVSQVSDAVRNWGEMAEFTDCCAPASCFILTIFRLLIYFKEHKNVLKVFETMRADWESASEEDRAILRKKCGPAFFLIKHFIICITCTMQFIFVYPILLVYFAGSDDWILPYGGYFYVDITKSPTYQIVYAITTIGGIYGLSNVAAINCLNVISIIHASANFLVLQNHLSSLKSDDQRSPKFLRLYIREHQRAIEFADTLEEIINKVALGQFIISTGLVCFAGLQIAAMMDNKVHLLKYAVFMVSAIFELFLFSYSGYQLTLESELVGDAAFGSDWVGSSFKQNLNIVMMRSTKPNKITAAKFYDMSLESFAMVLSTSFSYFTTLRAVNEE